MVPWQAAAADCSTLALKFAQNPNSLNVDDLATLRKCIDARLKIELHDAVRVEKSPVSPTVPAARVPSITK